MSRFLPGLRIIDTGRNPTDEEAAAWQDAENDPEWQLQRMESQQRCADQNWEVEQQYQQEVANATPWWQKIF